MSFLDVPPDDLEDIAAMLAALVPKPTADAAPGWAEGWQACCKGIEQVAVTIREQQQGAKR